MFPVPETYVKEVYKQNNTVIKIGSKAKLEKIGNKISQLLSRGIKLTPTAPNIENIKTFIDKEKIESLNISKTSLDDLLKNAGEKIKGISHKQLEKKNEQER